MELWGGGVNAIRDVLYSGSDQISSTSGSSTYNLSANVTDYDYLVLRFSAPFSDTTNTQVVAYDKIVKLPLPSDNVTDFNYRQHPNGELRFGGWIKINTTQNQVTVGVREIGSGFSSIYLASVTGIKLVNPNQYSTTEQRIGTWIDGKPLYQRTIQVTTPSNADTITDIYEFTDFRPDIVVDISGYAYITTATVRAFGYINSMRGSQNHEYVYVYYREYTDGVSNSRLRMQVAEFTDCPCYITIQYTKETN